QVTRAERAIQPLGIAEASRKWVQRVADAIHDQGQALLAPGLVALQKLGVSELEDRRLHRIESGKHPCDRARPRIGVLWQQARMLLGDMEDDRARLEQDKIAFL